MKTLRCAIWIALGGSLALRALAQSAPTPAQQQLREIYKELVEINTTDSAGSCAAAAEAMAARLKAGGLPAQDVQIIVPPGAPKKGNLVARYRGTGAKKPVMLLGHLDVVEAKREDWERDPFKLVEENGYFYARGASDDKAMVAVFVANLIRYRQEGYRPERDLILVAFEPRLIEVLKPGLQYRRGVSGGFHLPQGDPDADAAMAILRHR